MQQPATDYHCHILPGLDDGAPNIEESLKMASMLAAAGYRQVYCTPHMIRGMYDVPNSDVLHEVVKLQSALDEEGISIRLYAGREYYLDEYFFEYLHQPLLMEGTKCLMIEIPDYTPVALVKEVFFKIHCSGYIPLVAHTERCSLLDLPEDHKHERAPFWKSWFSSAIGQSAQNQSDVSLLQYLIELGCQFQANYGSFNGQYGQHIQSKARRFEYAGIYTHFGTDAHNARGLQMILAGSRR
jgi:protein-tyrosine phosphatase